MRSSVFGLTALNRRHTARIEAHQEARPPDWDTLEEPIDLVGALTPMLHCYDTVLLDCLTMWVSNLLLSDPGRAWARGDILSEARRLLYLYHNTDASWVVVSNEVGLGVVPSTELGRVYSDELGRVNQLLTGEADDVYFMAAGLPLQIKASAMTGHLSLPQSEKHRAIDTGEQGV